MRIQSGVASVENSMEVSAKFKHRLPRHPAIPFLDIFPKDLKAGTQAGICIPIYIAALFPKTKDRRIPIGH